MAPPDFQSRTKDILAKRARYQCSNPDCRSHTIGPNSDPDKATTIGEAAHIYGAKPGSARFDQSMSDRNRAEITNGIWLCKNCHGQIDRDEALYPAELLMSWRQDHEERVLQELGSRGEILRRKYELTQIEFLYNYPLMIQRIALDKPSGWEWRFTSELLRHLTRNEFRRLRDIQLGHYFKRFPRIHRSDFIPWVQERAHIMSNLIAPLDRVIQHLVQSWGEPGEPGDLDEIHHSCVLLRNLLTEMLDHEEELKFTQIPEEAEDIRTLLLDAIGNNLVSLEKLPDKLDEVIGMIGTDHGGTEEEPKTVTYSFEFSLPERFNERFDEAFDRYILAVNS